MANDRIIRLREQMRIAGITAYYVPSSDDHDSEYVEPYFRSREFLSGFTGSAGTLVVTEHFAGLWTDGRYFVQAAGQLAGSGIELMRQGREGVPTIASWLEQSLPEGAVLGFDSRVVNAETGRELETLIKKKNGSLRTDPDLAGTVWGEERPERFAPELWLLEERFSGESASHKLMRLREAMRDAGAEVHLLSGLDDIAWLLNLRKKGRESLLPAAHMLVTGEKTELFIDSRAAGPEILRSLRESGVSVREYEEIYKAVRELTGTRILLEPGKVNYALFSAIGADHTCIRAMNPTSKMKAVKNPVEAENMKKAHIKDGVALTRFLIWLKDHASDGIRETEAADRLEEFRREQEGYLAPSFDTISAYGSNAAMCHYEAVPGNDAVIEPHGLYLVDSGAQYPEGTTDVTRTIAMGPVSAEEKFHCTIVLAGMLRLAAAKFPYGCRGVNLDLAARAPLWKYGLDFNHGTGHGVGFVSNVHERPNAFRWRLLKNMDENAVLEPGMITSDEPGLYIEGSHGIRTENLLLCKKAEKNEFGQFLCFEFLTFAPIDLDTIDPAYLEPEDLRLLNAYQAEVFEKLSPYFTGEELARLKAETAELLPDGSRVPRD